MLNKDYGPRLGADPEIFVQNEESKVVPVCGKVGGTKENPLLINHLLDARFGPEMGRRRDNIDRKGDYAVQEDNVMLEFNIPAYREAGFFLEAISKILISIEEDVLKAQKLRPKYSVTQTFKRDSLLEFPQAFVVGCLPDMNAYAEDNLFERPPLSAEMFGDARFCGGHLHVQYNKNNVPPHVFAQFMDIAVELPFLRWDKQKLRRQFYGQPGIFREKPYGIEYRTPSNFWLIRTFRDKWLSSMVENIYSLAQNANGEPERLKSIYSKISWEDVQQAIKSEDYKLADDLVDYIRDGLGFYLNCPNPR